MNSRKFRSLVREFEFIERIINSQRLSADSLGHIAVARGDRNLLEVTPCHWSHDADQYGNHEGYRYFWVVADGEVFQLENAWSRSILFERNEQVNSAAVGSQLAARGHSVEYVVEVSAEGWDSEERIPRMVIHKMKNFDWRRFCVSRGGK